MNIYDRIKRSCTREVLKEIKFNRALRYNIEKRVALNPKMKPGVIEERACREWASNHDGMLGELIVDELDLVLWEQVADSI